ncbi:methionine synthase (B12-independent) [Filimonas lacunae]|uniref:5-methyltetrahydropteroyltriglutamate--homocysteine methyltransferase n=1 Tax=Filimonas lacunae TaxID=477680 RepID=A0A1N7Q4Q2_9BACT|nr:5-methyltetrahydropteroyltriglutamate--homocysteine S-methyltransferase [Filimonas lacunae]SIT17842.1 methionine synthase (B12-independent) [Filimonas lacunae]
MFTNILGYPRIGGHRELKKACESYWAGESTLRDLQLTAKEIRRHNWLLQQQAGIDLIPCNDFSFYDQVLDMCLTVSAIPERFHPLVEQQQFPETDLLFAMARGYQKDGYDITAMEMTKWFDTNYHYIVPEFYANQQFNLLSDKIVNECREAIQAGIQPKPVILGPVSFLLCGKEKEEGFHRIDLLKNLLPVYKKLMQQLDELNIRTIQFDEPYLSLNLTDAERKGVVYTYNELSKVTPRISILLASYFECYGENLTTVLGLPVQTIHLDLVRCSSQLDDILATDFAKSDKKLSLGVIDGRNIWKNDFENSLKLIQKAVAAIGTDRIMIAPSCSLLHVPCDLSFETALPAEIKNWLSFAKQKVEEVVALKQLATNAAGAAALLDENKQAIASRRTSPLIHKTHVKERVAAITDADAHRNSVFASRRQQQQALLKLPLFPTTTIGSFPQTADIRQLRAQLKKGSITLEAYNTAIKASTETCVRMQEELNIDVLVHGEFERNDMVEYFGEQLEGYVFTKNGWVQSYGSRCVKPPVIFGDVERKAPMTVEWTSYAQSLTNRPMKGMLTGPVTILQWSFVRDDQPRETTTMQIALAIRDEVSDLEKAGIKVIQIDEPAIREGLPLRKENWAAYLQWAVKAFKVSSCSVEDSTQIHTHMCYSEFNDIIDSIAAMDADVITIETSRSQMELLDAFADFKYPNEIGPGVYDIHSPRVPTVQEMEQLLQKAADVIPVEHLWVNPDCGLKTRKWPETKQALQNMVEAAAKARAKAGVVVA